MFTTDYGDPAQRFMYLDGAPFDGHTDSPRAFSRALKSPTTLYHAIGSAFVAAAVAVCLPFVGAPLAAVAPVFAAICLELPAYNVMCQRRSLIEHWDEYPSLRNFLIDKTGRAQNDLKAFALADAYYRNEIAGMKGAIFGACPFGAAVLFGGLAATGVLPLLSGAALVVGLIGVIAMPPFAMRLAWAVHARNQLHRADRPWTVTTDPPRVRRKVPAPVRRQLAVVTVPARARAL